jgi:hypothetical protein
MNLERTQMEKTVQKTRVSEQAVIQRINRVLIRKGEVLRKARERLALAFGDFYVLDIYRNFPIQKDVDLEQFAREVGALRVGEKVAA